ncbi:uncharacterized protein LOC128929992 isoform X2 [Callithrix jacchus]
MWSCALKPGACLVPYSTVTTNRFLNARCVSRFAPLCQALAVEREGDRAAAPACPADARPAPTLVGPRWALLCRAVFQHVPCDPRSVPASWGTLVENSSIPSAFWKLPQHPLVNPRTGEEGQKERRGTRGEKTQERGWKIKRRLGHTDIRSMCAQRDGHVRTQQLEGAISKPRKEASGLQPYGHSLDFHPPQL